MPPDSNAGSRSGPPPLPHLSSLESLILALLLAADHELYGLEMVDRSEGALKRGTVYVTLARMEEKGLIESKLETVGEGSRGSPRRKYKATPLGAGVVRDIELMRLALSGRAVMT